MHFTKKQNNFKVFEYVNLTECLTGTFCMTDRDTGIKLLNRDWPGWNGTYGKSNYYYYIIFKTTQNLATVENKKWLRVSFSPNFLLPVRKKAVSFRSRLQFHGQWPPQSLMFFCRESFWATEFRFSISDRHAWLTASRLNYLGQHDFAGKNTW